MRAITILPGVPNSAKLENVPDPSKDDGAILVDAIALGVCGTDHELIAGHYGEAPEGQEHLILGHEHAKTTETMEAMTGHRLLCSTGIRLNVTDAGN